MKTANLAIFVGSLALGMLASRTSLHAQSAGPTIVVGGDDKPWNRGVPTGRREAARALFLEGNRLFKVPLFSRAAESYAAALEQWNHPAFHFNLAIAQLNLGLEVEARDNLEQALKHGEEPLGAAQYAEAKKQLEEVEHQLGRLRIRCVTPGAEVTLDGATLFTGPGSHAGWTKPKVHEITAKRDGYLSEARRVTIAPGQVQELELNLITLSEAADKGRRWATWKPWTVVAAGAAIAAAGGVFHALSSRSFNAYDDGFVQLPCSTMPDPQSPGCARDKIPAALNAQLNAARRDQAIAVGGYVAGGAVITAGVVLLYLNRPRLIEQRGATRSVAVVPTVSGDTIGILLHVSE